MSDRRASEKMSRLIVLVAILILVAGAAVLNFTFTVTSATITSSQTSVSVSGPAALTVSGVGSDTGTFSASGSLANVSGGNVTVPFTVTLGHGGFTGTMTFPEGVLVGSGTVGGSATITSGTGLYSVLGNTTVSGSGFSGSVLTGGLLNFSVSGTSNGRSFTFSVTNAPIMISGTSVFSGPASLTLTGSSPDTGTFSASGSLATDVSGGNLTVPFTITLGHGTMTGNMTFPETALLSSGPVSGSATVTGGTGSYAGYTTSTLTVSGTITGSVLNGGSLSFSISGTINTGGPAPPSVTSIQNASSSIPTGFPNSGISPSTLFAIEGKNLADPNAPVVNQDSSKGLPTTLNGASVSVSVGGQTYTPALYHALSFEIAGVLPAATPTGNATVTVNYNGQQTQANVQIVPSAYGIDNYNGNTAVVTDAVSYALITYTSSAKPGQIVAVWGTGLGSDPLDSDTTSNGQQHAIPTPVQVWVGGVQAATPAYSGEGFYPGVHIVIFTIPANAPTGCYVPVAVVTGSGANGVVSNSPTIPIMPNGGVCQDAYTGLNGSQISGFSAQTNVSYGSVTVGQTTSPGPNGTAATTSFAGAVFQQVSGSSYTGGSVSSGTCAVNEINANISPVSSVTGLNAGTITVTPPSSGAITLTSIPQVVGEYQAQLPAGSAASSGTFAFTGTGGSGANSVGPFNTTVLFPNPVLTWTNQSASATVTRTAGQTYTWTGGAPGTYVIMSGNSVSATAGVSGSYTCIAPVSAGSFTVPSYVLLALPAGTGSSTIENSTSYNSFSASNLNYGIAIGYVAVGINSIFQ